MLMSRVILFLVGLNTVITVAGLVLGLMYLAPVVMRLANAYPVVEGESTFQQHTDHVFYPIEKIVVNLPGQDRERYVVLDLSLQATGNASNLKNIEPLVRNSVITSLSQLKFSELRLLSITELQVRIEQQLRQDFAAKRLQVPFTSVLVSKLLVQ